MAGGRWQVSCFCPCLSCLVTVSTTTTLSQKEEKNRPHAQAQAMSSQPKCHALFPVPSIGPFPPIMAGGRECFRRENREECE